MTRIYQPITLSSDALIQLDAQASHHLARVLRATIDDFVIIFNGQGNEYTGVITEITKKCVTVQLTARISREVESPLKLWLAQGISRGEKMDYIIQKAVELGVNKIIPLVTERCNVKLDAERREKRRQHWQSIVISACEQSGRNYVPEVVLPQPLTTWLESVEIDTGFVLSPVATAKLAQVALPNKINACIGLLIGPEGGLSEPEIAYANQKGFLSLNLGPRVLRTETAAVAAITALQCYFGDMT